MKIAALSAALLAIAAASPAAAEHVHRTSLDHQGRTLALSYEPRVETTFRQVDTGPRAFPRCIWSTRLSVQRTALGADNQPIAALSRRIAEEAKPRGGAELGHCTALSRKTNRTFGVSAAELRAAGAEAARDDAAALRTELAGLGTFHAAFAR